MNKVFSDSLRDSVLLAIASLVVGLLVLIFPGTSARLICLLCALLLILYGALHIVLYFVRKAPEDLFRHDFAKGLICLLAGIYLLLHPEILLDVLPVALGLVVVVDSIIKLQKAFDLIRLGNERWWIVLLFAIATAILGLLMLVNPFNYPATLMAFIGVGLVINGATDLWTAASIRRWVKRAAKAAQEAEEAAAATAAAQAPIVTAAPVISQESTVSAPAPAPETPATEAADASQE